MGGKPFNTEEMSKRRMLRQRRRLMHYRLFQNVKFLRYLLFSVLKISEWDHGIAGAVA
jgi:hypothetical protein